MARINTAVAQLTEQVEPTRNELLACMAERDALKARVDGAAAWYRQNAVAIKAITTAAPVQQRLINAPARCTKAGCVQGVWTSPNKTISGRCFRCTNAAGESRLAQRIDN